MITTKVNWFRLAWWLQDEMFGVDFSMERAHMSTESARSCLGPGVHGSKDLEGKYRNRESIIITEKCSRLD